jgi:hypothetical protein
MSTYVCADGVCCQGLHSSNPQYLLLTSSHFLLPPSSINFPSLRPLVSSLHPNSHVNYINLTNCSHNGRSITFHCLITANTSWPTSSPCTQIL